MIVLHVAPVSNKKATGLNYSIPKLIEALHYNGLHVALLTISSDYSHDYPFSVFTFKSLGLIPKVDNLPAPFDKPDLIVFHSTYIYKQALLAYNAKQYAIPYIITPRGGMTVGAQKKKWIKKKLGNLLFLNHMVKHAAAIHCLTENEATDVRNWKDDVFIVGNGIDLPSQLAQPGNHDPLHIIFIGRLDIFHKGLDLLIEACNFAKDALYQANAKVEIYGPGDTSDLMKLVDKYEINDIVYCKGPIYGEDKEQVYLNADIFVHTSRFEGHPISVLEALSYGIPCILTPGTNVNIEIAEAGAGWSVEQNSSDIANGIRQALQSDLNHMSKKAQAFAISAYSWDKIAQKTVQNYNKLINTTE